MAIDIMEPKRKRIVRFFMEVLILPASLLLSFLMVREDSIEDTNFYALVLMSVIFFIGLTTVCDFILQKIKD